LPSIYSIYILLGYVALVQHIARDFHASVESALSAIDCYHALYRDWSTHLAAERERDGVSVSTPLEAATASMSPRQREQKAERDKEREREREKEDAAAYPWVSESVFPWLVLGDTLKALASKQVVPGIAGQEQDMPLNTLQRLIDSAPAPLFCPRPARGLAASLQVYQIALSINPSIASRIGRGFVARR
ncbi:hypothetical protein KIPB_012400, partial [Kipferlia bialata]